LTSSNPRHPVASRKEDTDTTLHGAERAHIRRALEETNWVLGGPKGAATRLDHGAARGAGQRAREALTDRGGERVAHPAPQVVAGADEADLADGRGRHQRAGVERVGAQTCDDLLGA
jgi:hypothetical protein